ncbi:hypothetical protein [Nocardia abscessus]|uniref:hypothetical protein n=1 Tax=Nocardia abscessus TaxID=120957 RepID=UPI0024564612|nr:hypothetical protein [Nocardia abscessus]
MPRYAQFFVETQRDPLLEQFAKAAYAADMVWSHWRDAVSEACCLLTVQGIALADLIPAALLHHGHESRRIRAITHPGDQTAHRFAGPSAWNVLHQMGHFPADTPATMRAALHRGQLTIEQMINRYPIRNREVRQLRIDYQQVTNRRPAPNPPRRHDHPRGDAVTG